MRLGSPRFATGTWPLLLVGIGACLVPAAARGDGWVLPDSRLGVRTAPLLLISRPDIQADLKLDPALAAEAMRLLTDLRRQAASVRGQSGPEALKVRRAIDEAQTRWLQVRLTAEQRSRLEQVDLQWEGPAALLTRSRVADSLGLTDPQRAALSQAIVAKRSAQAEDRAPRERERILAEQALGVLTEDQRERWKAMLGTPLAIQPVAEPAVADRSGVRPEAPAPR